MNTTAERFVPTLATLSASQIRAIRSLPPLGQTPARTDESSRPAASFTDPAVYAQEQREVFRRVPVPVALSVQVPEPQMFLALEAYGLPLLLSRDAKGQVHVFLNACQHKGSKLVERSDAHKAGRVSCPYHAWTYSSEGKLVGVPRQEVFPSLRKEERGLTELPSREAGGFIWAILDAEAETADFSAVNDELVADLDAFRIGSQHLYGHKTFHLDANWKLVIEPFLEPYHIQRLHATTVAAMFADVPNITDRLGDHLRQVSGKANFEPAQLEGMRHENIHKTITHAYVLFPSTVIITSPYYISVMIIQPRGPATSTVEYFNLTREPADNDKARELFARSFEMILNVFGNEDFRAACLSQAGLESGALKEVLYGGLETPIPMFYAILDKHLARSTST
ncbi:aromatic ring-hydroxylating dioxygenase subunit alpha [Pelomonas sp. KK5]|uniref:aromatic ring-hydroxylating oxygenase subunit alpha n=1 Tax=Pelomonas sp. KK5 TaxID=1855730 RepID=UPI00097C4A95|nr:aromatic ring-hydroxylating dioxygenase subunit alpha [Pelomonas sp. KK5]